MRKLVAWRFELRKWQKQACKLAKERYEAGGQDFLCVATPGAGKTIFALRMAHYLLRHRMVERIVILCPTEHLKKQWALSAARFGINIDPNFDNGMMRETSDYFGVSITYAQVGRAPLVHKSNVAWKKTFAIFDEIHHLGDDMSWGDAGRDAFENASFRLAISGTPFRRDTNPIPFINYTDEQSKADYTYGYQHAIKDNVCRPVFFPAFDGKMKWRSAGRIMTATFSDMVNKEQASERLRTALSATGQWLEEVIIDADSKLDEIRRGEHEDAAGLIITMDQAHAREVGKKLKALTGITPVIVVSEDPKASKKIKEFTADKNKWIIAVKMISEGVDIPRLRVGIFATNIKSELFFRQAVGRFVRMIQGLSSQQAYFYIPKDRILVEYAKQIEMEREHALNKPIEDEEFEEEQLELLWGSESDEQDNDKFEAISSKALEKFQYELDFGLEFARPEEESIEDNEEEDHWLEEDEHEEEIPLFELAGRLKDDIKEIARVVASKKQKGSARVDWDLPHKQWIQVGGKPIDQESVTELKKRKKWLLSQL
ncbi:MAG: hypothetical protein SCALA702_34080 [Melioribacteraceae bacterium]|nr:MAG: hypothetical protein SCALA702_34080 [Melioribacteraceae bacterium]